MDALLHFRYCLMRARVTFAVFSTRTNRMEVNLDRVEQREVQLAASRRAAGPNPLKRLRLQLLGRTLFLSTPPALWGFLCLLGLLSAITLYV